TLGDNGPGGRPRGRAFAGLSPWMVWSRNWTVARSGAEFQDLQHGSDRFRPGAEAQLVAGDLARDSRAALEHARDRGGVPGGRERPREQPARGVGGRQASDRRRLRLSEQEPAPERAARPNGGAPPAAPPPSLA